MTLARDDLHINPRDAFAVVLLANCEAKLGHRAEAERHAAEAAILAPNNRDVWIRTAKVYAALDERSAGGEAVRKAVALGYEPNMIAADDELQPLGRALKRAIDAGLAAREKKGVTQ
jgi:tetratricopeptide (TPR) repeat protein